MHAFKHNEHKHVCMFLYFAIAFKTLKNFGVMKKIEVAQEGPMYTHNDFYTHAYNDFYTHACMAVRNLKGS